eukprot:TRINITY_DN12926_c0_g1_i1.p1 TRINITY_DN12926_c0_g1~~TRINITY_DN12926_c0_g1_i1.p1  ORF type:complete len:824 (+),score=167.91 TRINITY_DN12926_c0_g1_i1:1-2472(+)
MLGLSVFSVAVGFVLGFAACFYLFRTKKGQDGSDEKVVSSTPPIIVTPAEVEEIEQVEENDDNLTKVPKKNEPKKKDPQKKGIKKKQLKQKEKIETPNLIRSDPMGRSAKSASPASFNGSKTRPRSTEFESPQKERKRYKFKNEERHDINEIITEFTNPISGVPVKDHDRKVVGSHKNTFVGSEAVDWLILNVEGLDKRTATEIGLQMWARGVFAHIHHRARPFTNDDSLFRINKQYVRAVKRKSGTGSSLIKQQTPKKSKVSKLRKKRPFRRSRKLSATDIALFGNSPDQGVTYNGQLLRKACFFDCSELSGWVQRWCVLDKNNKKGTEGSTTEEEEEDEEASAWAIFVYETLYDKHLQQLLKSMLTPTTGLRIKKHANRINKLKQHKDTFVGKNALDWCLKEKHCSSRNEAVVLFTDLLKKGLISSIDEDKGRIFRDERALYRFRISAEDIQENCEPNLLTKIPLHPKLVLRLDDQKKGDFTSLALYNPNGESILAAGSTFQIENKSSFSLRLPRSYDQLLKEWINAIGVAIVFSDDSYYDVESIGAAVTEEMDENSSMSDDESEEISVDVLTAGEKAVLSELRRELAKDPDPEISALQNEPDNHLLMYLRCRRLEVAAALALVKSSVPFRRENNLFDVNVRDVLKFLQEPDNKREGMLVWDPDARDKMGRAVMYIYPQYYNPKNMKPMELVRAMTYLMDLAQLHDDEIQRKGFTIIVDLKGSKYNNFDKSMPKIVLDAIVSKYPARIGYVIIVNVPWFFRFIWLIMRPLMSEQLVAKFHITKTSEVPSFFTGPQHYLSAYEGASRYDNEKCIAARLSREK